MAIIGWGEMFSSSLLAASSVLQHEATRFHKKAAPCASTSIKPTSHYWPTSCQLALGLPKRAPNCKAFTNSQANFIGVPAELKLDILRSISEVKTLRALAIASKSYHAVFEENPKGILSSVLATEINPEVFPVALAAAKSSKLRWTQKTHFDQVNKFLGEYCGEGYDTVTPTEVSARLLMATSRLHDDVSYLVNDFVRSRIHKFSLLGPASGDSKLSCDPLSTNELKRINRAFHLLEMFTNLFRNHDTADYPDVSARQITSDDIAGMFLSMVPAYQIEEMVCVKDFIFDKLSDVFVDIQRELSGNRVTYVKFNPGQPIPELPSGFELEPDFHPAARWMSLDFPGGINLSPDGVAYDDLKETLLMKGLPYLRRLFKAPTSLERKKILLEDLAYDVHNCNTFHYALKANPNDLLCDEEAYEAFYHQDEDLFESEEEGPNAGWAWANNNKVELRYGQWITEELRDWGYVMWDKTRLEKMGVLDFDSSQWRHERDGFKNTSIEDHPYHSRHLLHCLRGDESKTNNHESEIDMETMEELGTFTESATNIKCPIQSPEKIFEETSSMRGEEEPTTDEEYDEEIEGYVEGAITAAKGTLADFRLSEGNETNLDDLIEEEVVVFLKDCPDTTPTNKIVSDNKTRVDLNPEDEKSLSDMEDDLKYEAAAKDSYIKLCKAAPEAYYSDPEKLPSSDDSTIIFDPEPANEVNEVPVSNPTTDHADFAVDLDAASESTTSEGPAIITAVDLDGDSKNGPPSHEPANHTADQVVDHLVTPSFAFGCRSLESSTNFSEGSGQVPDHGPSSAFCFKSDTGLWKTGETFLLPPVSENSNSPTGSISTFATKSSFKLDVLTLPSSTIVDKASAALPFVFGDKPVPAFNLDAPKIPTASSSDTTEATAKPSFQFGQNFPNDFNFDGAKMPTMSLPSTCTSQPPKLTFSEEASVLSVASTPPGLPRSPDSSPTLSLPTPKRRKASTAADSGYGSDMSDKSASPPPPEFAEWSSQPTVNSPTANFLALKGITATIILDPTVEAAVDEYDTRLSRVDSGVDMEPVWDPAEPEDSHAMKELKVEIEHKERGKLTDELEDGKEPVDELEEKKERFRAIRTQQADSRKKKGGKKGKKTKKGKKADAGTRVEEISVDTNPVDKISVEKTPTEKANTAPVITAKTSPKGKVQNCKSTGRARFRNGKCGQGLVQPATATSTL